MTADQTPPNDTGAPEWIWATPDRDGDWLLGFCSDALSDDTGAEYVRADLSAAREAAAWQAGIDALLDRVGDLPISEIAADEVIYAAKQLTPPTDPAVALDRLIAERVRYERREAFEEAADIVEKECTRILSKQDGTIAQVDANLRLIALLLPDIEAALRTRGSKDGRDG